MHIRYSSGFKLVSSWMNKYDLISNGEIRKKANTKNKNKETITRENQDESKSENQEMIAGENQDVANAENHEMTTSENQEDEAATSVVGRSLRSGFSNSSLSPDSVSLAMEEDEEGIDDDSSEEVLVDYTRSIEAETATSKASTSSESVYHGMLTAIHLPGLFNMWKKPQTKLQALSSVKGAPKSAPKNIPKSVTKNAPKLTRRKTKRIRGSRGLSFNATLVDAELCYLKPGWKNFALSELQAATDNFSHENLIGQGGYAEVYRGQLEDGQFVAIKRLTRGSPEEMTTDYLSELGIIVHVDHPNIAKMIGYGVEGGMHLILELSPHGSLASLLYGPKEKLNWDIRHKIAFGTAEGICYLHEGCQRRIIHKDIKAANILLTEDFQPQISDFGLAKWLPDKWTHHIVSKIEGTFGYLPPEFFMHGIADEKTDVYAYGVLLLEIITGRQALDSSQKSLVMWAKPLLKKSSMKELVDPTLADAYNTEQLTRLLLIASACINQTSASRPQMSKVVQALKGDEEALAQIIEENQSLRRLQRTFSEEFFDAEEFNSASLNELDVNDINRHMEIVLGEDTGSLNEN
ncbi:hypothetical protein AB3S75_046453 [Citrus x aurantiifolia]